MSESNTTVDQFVVFFWARWPVGLFPWSSLVGCEVVVLISLPWPYHCYYISHNNNLVFSNCCSSRPLWATGGRIWSASWFSRGHWGDFHLICGLFILHQENPGFLTPPLGAAPEIPKITPHIHQIFYLSFVLWSLVFFLCVYHMKLLTTTTTSDYDGENYGSPFAKGT